MKTNKLSVLFFLSMFLTLITYSIDAQSRRVDALDAAIRETSNYLNGAIPKQSKIVILNIQSDFPALSEYVIDELIANAVNDKTFSVVDRHQLDSIRAEQNFQLSGEVADNQALEIGKFFGAQTIVSGAISKLGNGYRIRVRALEVQTALVQGQFNRNINSSPLITTLVSSSTPSAQTSPQTSTRQNTTPVATSSSSSSSSTRQTTAVPSINVINNTGQTLSELGYTLSDADKDPIQPINMGNNPIRNNSSRSFNLPNINVSREYDIVSADILGNIYLAPEVIISNNTEIIFTSHDIIIHAPKALKIGDKGPAGGYIFYDKGNNNGGWRYLEAAPAEAEFQAVWSVRYTNVENTQAGLGFGKRNTQLIVDLFAKTSGEWDTAAQKCAELDFGGFKDWFLPSRDELDQMYGNLKRRNLGEFKNGWYHSSSLSSSYSVMQQSFETGRQVTDSRSDRCYVRPVRQVPGPQN